MLTNLLNAYKKSTAQQILEVTSKYTEHDSALQKNINTYFSRYYLKHFSYADFYNQRDTRLTEALKVRKAVSVSRPTFRRYLHRRFMRLSRSGWRKPRGMHNKLRKSIKGKGAQPSLGYRGPKLVRGYNVKGYPQRLCRDLYSLKQAITQRKTSELMVRLASTLGLKKRVEAQNLAHDASIYVVNRIKWEKLLLCN